MCPLWPVHILLMYLITLCPLWFVACTLAPKAATHIWNVTFKPSEFKLAMSKTNLVWAYSNESWLNSSDAKIIRALVADTAVASVNTPTIEFERAEKSNSWRGEFNLTGNFLGYTSLRLCLIDKLEKNEKCLKQSNELQIRVSREKGLLDRLFTTSVIVLVSIIFINFGCALEFRSLKQAIIRPVGPIIGLVSHFFFMPLISYGLGELFFPDSRPMRLGLFFTGISPAGGASNIWTYALGGNLNLSVTMTAVSTLASFALIPLWVFTLGSVIFAGGPLRVPYKKIVRSAVGLLISLGIGCALQIYCKRIATIMVRLLKPFSAALIVFIIVFAVVTNSYLFGLFNWQIIVAGFSLPFIGYAIGWILASVMNQHPDDKLAICIETGVQNTGIAIFLLQLCLTEPASDITTVVPVAVALMTPLPVLFLYLVRRFTRVLTPSEEKLPALVEEDGGQSVTKSNFTTFDSTN